MEKPVTTAVRAKAASKALNTRSGGIRLTKTQRKTIVGSARRSAARSA